MAGQLHGEVLSYARRLYRAGVSRNAIDALSVVAEACRVESRRGEVFRGRVADKLCATERTATRAMAELIGHGLVVVVQRAGGRGRTGRGTVYEMVSLPAWLHDPVPGCPADPDPGDTPVSRGPDPEQRSAGHDGGAPIDPTACGQPDPRDIPGPSAGHPGVSPPVGPVTTPGGTTEVTTRPRATRTPPPTPTEPRHDPGSVCGQLDCRAPAPCGACGRARRAEAQAADRAAAEAAAQARREQAHLAERERERRRVAAATCPNGCEQGYVGTWVCDHRRILAVQDCAGYRQALQVAAAAAASADRKAALDRTRHPARQLRRRPGPWRPLPAPAAAIAS
ncbi:hypothetical protein [Pseudonocardia sp. WMMC193]|uniref:hypothetical protein n=1 Tax=Pseudonocardia sp. WMMC193 TaxID=2911965 RepID=UPI001F463088|nr:hypothetical protein [Pseudonocardia sp. WMMC193]MCF7550994.1 hypothetical protein [Pseudonocardia sp. WMMC193]